MLQSCVILAVLLQSSNAELSTRDGECTHTLGDFIYFIPSRWISCTRELVAINGLDWTPTKVCRCLVKEGKPDLQVVDEPYYDNGECFIPVKNSWIKYRLTEGEWRRFCPKAVFDYYPGDDKQECRCVRQKDYHVRFEFRKAQPVLVNGKCSIPDGNRRGRVFNNINIDQWYICPEGIKVHYPRDAKGECKCSRSSTGSGLEFRFRDIIYAYENGQCQFRDRETKQVFRFRANSWLQPCPADVIRNIFPTVRDPSLTYCRCYPRSRDDVRWRLRFIARPFGRSRADIVRRSDTRL